MADEATRIVPASWLHRGRSALDALATILLVVVAVTLLLDRTSGRSSDNPPRPTIRPPAALQSVRDAPVSGAKDAKIMIIEYSDFQCPFCAHFANDVFPELKSKYLSNGRVGFAFRHFPIVGTHPRSMEAAVAAQCAGRQGKFWEIHDHLFHTQPSAITWDFFKMVSEYGVDTNKWKACVNNDGKNQVASDLRDALTIGVSSTPIFLVGLRRDNDMVRITDVIVGAQPPSEFERVIEHLLRS